MASFAEAIGAIVTQLRENVPSHSSIARAVGGLDQLGRKLHGFGFVRDGEIADHLTAAIGQLGACHALPETHRPECVRQAVRHLELAIAHLQTDGLSP